MRGGAAKPQRRQLQIAGRAEAQFVAAPELVHRFRVPCIGGHFVPQHRLDRIGRDAAAFCVELCEQKLCGHILAIGRLA